MPSPHQGGGGKLGGDGAVGGDGEGACSEGERRVERVRGTGPRTDRWIWGRRLSWGVGDAERERAEGREGERRREGEAFLP